MPWFTRALLMALMTLLGTSAHRATAEPIDVTIATGDYPPYVHNTSPPTGLLIELVTAVFRDSVYRPKWIITSWPRVEASVQNGQAFGGMPYRRTPEREQIYNYSSPLYRGGASIFSLRGRLPAFNPKAPSDLIPYRVATPRGYWFEPEFRRAGVEMYYSNDEVHSFQLLQRKLADIVVLDTLHGIHLINKHFSDHPQQFSWSPGLPEDNQNVDNYMIISRRYPNASAILKQLNDGLQKLRDNGEYTRILQRYQDTTTNQ
ncbi:transporter substrate-binding domain-containing protein [Chitinivorax sp. B]|uniref:substrate-binding periplasmic protein n=1 Tax=Chitinivorax sp. B TaxID=2502235 RepID=UPI001484D62C|nr:transporter substrate-binding domain-containing protein [Chitinivorax sp. B]